MVALSMGPLMQKLTVDGAILHHYRPLLPLIGIMIGLAFVRFGAASIWRYQGNAVSLALQTDLRNAIYDHVQSLDARAQSKLQNGQLIARSSSDLTMVQQLVSWVPMAVGNLLNLGVSLTVMFVLSPLLGLLVLAVLSTVVVAIQVLRRDLYAASWDAQHREGIMANMVEEAITGVRVVKGFGQEQSEVHQMHGALTDMFGARIRSLRIRSRLTATVQAIPVIGQVMVLLAGGYFALHGQITLGTFLAFLSYLSNLAGPARMLGTMIAMGPQVRASAERIFEVLALKPEIVEETRTVTPLKAEGAVRFEHVRFDYPGTGQVLRDFNLEIAPGERVAIVGPSGSGKSTALQLMVRQWDPDSGRITLDGTDIRLMALDDVRRRVGVAFQETFLFDGTIGENIAYGRPDADQGEIEAAADAAAIHDFISSLKDGYETAVGEEGLSLSGGQRQRVALARALLTRPEVLVLDDVTASVDAGVERRIVHGLDRSLAGQTTVMVAYRKSTILLCDRVVVVDDGQVVAQGSHQQLLRDSSLYRRLLAELEEGDSEVTGAEMEHAMAGQDPAWHRPPPASSLHIGTPPTAELERMIENLPPIVDEPKIDMEEESRHQGNFTLGGFLLPYSRPLLVCLVIVALDAMCTLSGPLFVRTGETAISEHSLLLLGGVCAGFLAVVLFDWWDMWAEFLWTGRTGERLLLALRSRIYGQVHRLGLDFYDRVAVGRIITRMTSDVDALSNLLQTGIITGVISVFTFLGMATVVFFLDWKLALIVLCVVPPTLLATLWYRHVASRAYDEARQLISTLNARQHEALAGVQVTQSFCRQELNFDRFKEISRRQFMAGMRGARATSLYASLIDFESLTITAVILGIGAVLIGQRQMSLASLLAFLLYLASVFAPIQQLVQVLDSYQRARAGSHRIQELLTRRTAIPVPADAVDPGVLTGRIEFADVSLRYDTTREYALRDVDLHIQPGERVALVGQTGAGKSSIAKLVARFYDPTEGAVLIDGRDLRKIDLAAYHGQLGYVPQEPFLFSRSVRDNIAYARPDATDAEVEMAARAVGAHRFITRLPHGYHHVLTERGRSLSAGQRQLLCLARAMVARPRVLILDEPTANLDMASEQWVSRAMDVASRGRTTVLVSHRPAAHSWVGRIFEVAGGRIVTESEPEPEGRRSAAS